MCARGKGCWGQKQDQCDMCEPLGKVWNAPVPCSTHIQPPLHPQSKPPPPTPLPQPLTCPLSGMWNASRNVMRCCYPNLLHYCPSTLSFPYAHPPSLQPLTCPLSGMWNAPRNVMRWGLLLLSQVYCITYPPKHTCPPFRPRHPLSTSSPVRCRECGMLPGT